MSTQTSHLPLDKLLVTQVELNFLTRSVLFLGQPVVTTGLEFNLLTVLMNDAGSLISRKDIAERIFQRQLASCDKSINSHMANLRKKLLVISKRSVIQTVKGRGYIFLKY
ncbi:winged helix-turn-helix domain-containing protein [Colwellia psychrerythraea]|uniref:Transcriptional regulator, winged helix family n=1 Tax=Colwellia psychrerythraea TaxID=28229 RepID=A0A099L3Y5_COLPS|nr:winged helix-turn-helix domain-containing protein [Colwellia psychrerythraea]KGJ97571.1 transcriptional regulator, winged helix family [Colwellia psychrerythraea]